MKRNKTAMVLLCTLAVEVLLLTGLRPSASAFAAAGGGTQYIVKYKDDAAPFHVVSGSDMERLRAQGLLEWYEPDGEATLIDPAPDMVLFGTLSDYHEDEQWNLDLIGADGAFRRGCLGQGVRVGVLDSGIDPHPALEGCLQPGHNYIQDADDPADTADSYGHGTRVAGLIAGVNDKGYIGAAPGAALVPLKVTDGRSVKISTL
ncbi:MAG: S8 family serine peptidase, partial [Oscillospiraceae bacterium]|nr:S8 family serine peptidase [Oscillospiraceae bacterium]